jgi:hypothetical protein
MGSKNEIFVFSHEIDSHTLCGTTQQCGNSVMSLKKRPIHVLYRELFRFGKRFDSHPILKLWGREVSKVLQISPGGEYMLTLFARYLAQRQNNWKEQSRGKFSTFFRLRQLNF